MKIQTAAGLLLGFILACGVPQAWAGSLNFGAGLGFVDASASEAFEGGWDVILGYEREASEGWHSGVQIHYLRGWTDKGSDMTDTRMYFQSAALYMTARPENWFLQFSGGVVSAEYQSRTMAGSGTGLAAGAGIVLGSESLRLHVLDWHRYMVGGQVFDVYSISLGVVY